MTRDTKLLDPRQARNRSPRSYVRCNVVLRGVEPRRACRQERKGGGLGYRHEFPPSARRYAVTQLLAKQTVERAESAVLETLVFGGLIATAVVAAIYDIGLWIGAW